MIACVGDLMLDVLVERREGQGIEDVVGRLALQPGGSAANVAAWLAYQGLPSAFVGAAGTDLAGDLLLEELRRHGVRCQVARYAGVPSGLLLLETLADGGVRPAGRRGANNLFRLDEPAAALLGRATWLHLNTYAFYPEEARAGLLGAVGAAHDRGAPVSLDLGAPHVMRHLGRDAYLALLRRLAPDVLLANELEAAALFGEGDEPLAALAALAPCAVLKRGAGGCAVRCNGERFEQPALAATLVDPVGAGDAFVAGFIAERYRGAGLRAAVLRAAELGAACVSRVGGRPPSRDTQG